MAPRTKWKSVSPMPAVGRSEPGTAVDPLDLPDVPRSVSSQVQDAPAPGTPVCHDELERLKRAAVHQSLPKK